MAQRDTTIPYPTDDQVLAAMDPNGAVMKYGEIVEQCKDELSGTANRDQLYRAVDRVLQRMKRAGRVDLVKGRGAGWKISRHELASRSWRTARGM